MLLPLSRPYTSREGLPVVDRVDTRLFTEIFFSDCMSCGFCHDSCCQYGATVEAPKYEAILARADELEPIIGIPRDQWFTGIWHDEPSYPGQKMVRTTVVGDRCVFLNRNGRGCLLHKFALDHQEDVHLIKPLACNMFPMWWEDGALILPPEIEDRSLVCLDQGTTLYQSARNDLLYYFGSEFIGEMDAMQQLVCPGPPPNNLVSLPLVG